MAARHHGHHQEPTPMAAGSLSVYENSRQDRHQKKRQPILVAGGSWLLAPGSWLVAPGWWLLAGGSWLLAGGSWLLAPG